VVPALVRVIALAPTDPAYEPYLVGSAAASIGKAKATDHLPALLALRGPKPVLQGVAEALGALGAEPGLTAEVSAAVRSRLGALMEDPSADVRRASRAAAKAFAMEGVPEREPGAQNDWEGLPRPKAPLLGVELGGTGPRLTEGEILRLADAIREQRVRVVLATTAGAFTVEVDAEAAPADAVGFVLAAHGGTYDGTRWHRVVPNFVIQGGDPYGHGGGACGYAMPDEITDHRFVRGALGMPKDAPRDTGGCQLFFMHTAYRPLDGRYSCYGRVVAGMDAVDKIRVGDRIVSTRLAVP
jgi:peptidyl-prolyl cis-trans isomerase B (cyclophilin B)